MKYYVNWQAPCLALPFPASPKLLDIPLNAVVESVEEEPAFENYVEVIYKDSRTHNWRGWVHVDFLDEYQQGYKTDCVLIENQTPDLNDFEQYMIYNGVKQVNMCGELCVAFCLGLSLGEVLENWQREKPGMFRSIFSSGRARGTGWQELASIFQIYAVEAKPLHQALFDQGLKRERYTVDRLKKLCNAGDVITGVSMDATTGRLRGAGIGHWVVLLEVWPERVGYGMVKLYNPACNGEEMYSWTEFIAAAKRPFGLYIPGEKERRLSNG